MDNRALGSAGENLAASILIAEGYTIVDRNFRGKYGEIDIVAANSKGLTFVEVKTRSTMKFGLPCEAVDRQKRNRMYRCALDYLNKHALAYGDSNQCDFRMEIIEVLVNRIGEF